jgi:hypothetical protein
VVCFVHRFTGFRTRSRVIVTRELLRLLLHGLTIADQSRRSNSAGRVRAVNQVRIFLHSGRIEWTDVEF